MSCNQDCNQGRQCNCAPTPDVSLDYIDHDGAPRTVRGCDLTLDKAGRYWLWSDQEEINLAHKARSKEACLLASIDSLLFTIQLRDERIAKLQRLADLAEAFANEIKPDEED